MYFVILSALIYLFLFSFVCFAFFKRNCVKSFQYATHVGLQKPQNCLINIDLCDKNLVQSAFAVEFYNRIFFIIIFFIFI